MGAVCGRLIYDRLSFANVFADFRELLSISVAGGVPSTFFGEDKLKLPARAAEEPVTANHKAFPLITRLKERETVTAADKQKEKSGEMLIKLNLENRSTWRRRARGEDGNVKAEHDNRKLTNANQICKFK